MTDPTTPVTDRPTGPATATASVSDWDELRHLADLLVWGMGDNEWTVDHEFADESAYAEFVRLCSPQTILALLDAAAERARIFAALPAALHAVALGCDDSCFEWGPGAADGRRLVRSNASHQAAALVAALEKELEKG